MKCPRCIENMESSIEASIRINRCFYCEGAWLSRDSLSKLLENAKEKITVAESFGAIQDTGFDESERRCPECTDTKLFACSVGKTELDFCNTCKGLFFDKGELEFVFGDKPNEKSGVGQYAALEGAFWALVLGLGGGG